MSASVWEYGLDPAKGEGLLYCCARDAACDFTGIAQEVEAHYAAEHPARPAWRAANNGTGARMWFLIQEDAGTRARYHERSDGRLVRYASMANANKAAARLNAGR